jgi:hypothetical protein
MTRDSLDYSDRINIIAPIVAFVLFLIGLIWIGKRYSNGK